MFVIYELYVRIYFVCHVYHAPPVKIVEHTRLHELIQHVEIVLHCQIIYFAHAALLFMMHMYPRKSVHVLEEADTNIMFHLHFIHSDNYVAKAISEH